MMLLKMVYTFFKIGLFTIGGGYAMIPLIHKDIVGNGWLTSVEITDVIAIAKMTPGPFAVNAATFAGMKIYGFGGALACTAGVILPSLIITTIVARFFFSFSNHRLVQGALAGIRPVVVALIAYAVWSVSIVTLFKDGAVVQGIVSALQSFDLRLLAILALAIFLLLKAKAHPIAVIAISGALSIVFYMVLPLVFPVLA